MAIPDRENTGSGGGKYLNVSASKAGPLKFTIVTEGISGFEGWTEGSKAPIRSPKIDGFPEGTVWRKEKPGFKEGPKQFWAWLVRDWNDGGALKVFAPTQWSIVKAMRAIEKDPEWGELPGAGYALKVTRGSRSENNQEFIEYSVLPVPPVKTTKEQDAELEELLNSWTGLVALYGGGDPFVPFGEALSF